MDKTRVKELVIAGVILIALIAVVVFMLMRTEKPQEEELPPPARITPAQNVPEVNPEDIPKIQEVSASAITRTFVERIGSYSSEASYANITDVLGIVTAELAQDLEEERDSALRHARSRVADGYYGISTSYLGAKTVTETDTSLVLLVQTQRAESFGSPGNTQTRYQEVEVSLIREGTDWKVSAYVWQD